MYTSELLVPAPRESVSRPAVSISTRELMVWASLLFVSISAVTLVRSIIVAGTPGHAIGGIEFVAWGCALVLLRRNATSQPATARQITAICALMAGAVLLPGALAYGCLTGVGLVVLLDRTWPDAERRAGFVLLAISMQKLWSSVILILFAEIILRLDTAAAGLALSVAVPGSTWSGNMVKPPDDVGIVVGPACSSFANLSLICLCFGSLLALDGGRFTRRAFVTLFGICVTIVAFNTVRLTLTASSLAGYHYWHDGEGAELFGIATTVLCITLCSLGSRWASARA